MKKLLLALVLVSVGEVMAKNGELVRSECSNKTLPKCGSYLQYCPECTVCPGGTGKILSCDCQNFMADVTLPEGWSENTCVDVDEESHSLKVRQ